MKGSQLKIRCKVEVRWKRWQLKLSIWKDAKFWQKWQPESHKACTLYWATEPERLKFYCFGLSLRYKKGVQFCLRCMKGVTIYVKISILKGKGFNFLVQPPLIKLYWVLPDSYPVAVYESLRASIESNLLSLSPRLINSNWVRVWSTPTPPLPAPGDLVRQICLNIKITSIWWSLPLFSSLEFLNKYW